jgi:HEPN domain-containing protein
MAKILNRHDATGFLSNAKEFLESAGDDLEKGRTNAAAFTAVQAMINANDALTVYMLGKRATRGHREAIKLHVDVVRKTDDSSYRYVLKHALEVRNDAGYTGRTVSKRESERIVGDATSFIAWVEEQIAE